MKLELDIDPQEIADAHELLAEGAMNRRSFAALESLRTKADTVRLNRSSQSIRHKLSLAEVAARQSQPVPIPTTDSALVPFIRKQAT